MYIDTGYKPNKRVQDAIGAISATKEVPAPFVHKMRISDGDVVIHEFVRCLNPDGVEGFFDLVTQTFHPIEGG